MRPAKHSASRPIPNETHDGGSAGAAGRVIVLFSQSTSSFLLDLGRQGDHATLPEVVLGKHTLSLRIKDARRADICRQPVNVTQPGDLDYILRVSGPGVARGAGPRVHI